MVSELQILQQGMQCYPQAIITVRQRTTVNTRVNGDVSIVEEERQLHAYMSQRNSRQDEKTIIFKVITTDPQLVSLADVIVFDNIVWDVRLVKFTNYLMTIDCVFIQRRLYTFDSTRITFDSTERRFDEVIYDE